MKVNEQEQTTGCRLPPTSLMLGLLLLSAWWRAAGVGLPHGAHEAEPQDLPSLQNGMRLYVNYCLGCHSLQFQRYERTVPTTWAFPTTSPSSS
jgi:hypothetical protein